MKHTDIKKMAFLAAAMLIATCGKARIYNITEYGAVSDTTRLSTISIQKAIDECHAAGGGTVMVPAGNYKMGSIILKSNVTLQLEQGATLYGSTSLTDYKPMHTDYVSLRTSGQTIQLIYADNVDNVTICGQGTIDGRGGAFKKLAETDEGITRPHLLRFIQSRNITVRDVTLRNSGCWMQHYLACDGIIIQGIRVNNRNNYNNDALDLDGCHEVIVSNMIADSDDDGITLKSTSPRLCENISISGCVVSSHCNAIKLGTETNGGFRNINITNCVVKPSYDQSSHFYGRLNGTSAISLEIVDGGVLENVNVSDITITGTESPIFVRLGNRARAYSPSIPVAGIGSIRGVNISNILVTDAGPTGCSITGLAGHPVEDITLNNIHIAMAGGQGKTAIPTDEREKAYPEATMWGILPAKGFYVNHARNVSFNNVTIKTKAPDARPEYILLDNE
jgi:polygalacturonase